MRLFHLKFLIMLIFMNMFEKTITTEKLYLNQESVSLDKWKSMIYLITQGLIGRNFSWGVAGCPMHIATVLPHQKQLGKGHSRRLSRKARHRLEIIDWYNQVSERKSRTGLKDASGRRTQHTRQRKSGPYSCGITGSTRFPAARRSRMS